MDRIFHLYKSDLNVPMGKMPKSRYNQPAKDAAKKRKRKRKLQNQARHKN